MIDKVLKGLKCCVAKEKGLTVKDCDVDCPYFHEGVFCKNALHGDTIGIIQQLESDNEAKQKRVEKLEKDVFILGKQLEKDLELFKFYADEKKKAACTRRGAIRKWNRIKVEGEER